MHPDDDLLAAVALGETIDDDTHQHVWGCIECRREVGELRDVLAIVTQRPPVSLTKPNPDVWDQIEAQLGRAGDELISSDRRDDRRARPRRIMPWVAGAAAAGLVVGGVSGAIIVRGDEATSAVVATTALKTLDTDRADGTANVERRGSRLDLAVRTGPLDAGSGYIEVWLINSDQKRMVSVGVLPPGTSEKRFPIAADLLTQGYLIVDVSREAFDDKPQHSGDSLLRGTLPA